MNRKSKRRTMKFEMRI